MASCLSLDMDMVDFRSSEVPVIASEYYSDTSITL